MSKKINRIIPKSMKPIGEKLAEIHCRDLGLTENTPEYEEEAKKYIYNFNDEAYGLSMTPSGLISDGYQGSNPLTMSNPATPKVQAHYFDLMDKMFGKKGYVAKHVNNADHALKFERQIRGSIASLVHFLLESKYHTIIKSKGSKISDFEFKQDGGAANNDTVLSHYLRLFYTVKLTQLIESLFVDFDASGKLKIEDIISEVFGTDEWEKNPYGSLNPKAVRENFVSILYSGEAVSESVHEKSEKNESAKGSEEGEVYGPQLEGKKQNPRKSDLNSENINERIYFAHDEGLYFDKVKLTNYIEKNKNDCAQVVPKKSYVANPRATHVEVKNADMNEPIVFGTIVKKGKAHNFLIMGEAQILKANQKGIPSIDCLVLDGIETLKMLQPTQKTLKKITDMKNELVVFNNQSQT